MDGQLSDGLTDELKELLELLFETKNGRTMIEKSHRQSFTVQCSAVQCAVIRTKSKILTKYFIFEHLKLYLTFIVMN